MNERDETRLRDMLDEANKARRFVEGKDRQDLDNDDMLAYAVVRAIELIGEAAARVTVETREAHPEVAWKDIIGMRNQVIHRYNNVNLDIVWQVVSRNIPDLIAQLTSILSAI